MRIITRSVHCNGGGVSNGWLTGIPLFKSIAQRGSNTCPASASYGFRVDSRLFPNCLWRSAMVQETRRPFLSMVDETPALNYSRGAALPGLPLSQAGRL